MIKQGEIHRIIQKYHGAHNSGIGHNVTQRGATSRHFPPCASPIVPLPPPPNLPAPAPAPAQHAGAQGMRVRVFTNRRWYASSPSPCAHAWRRQGLHCFAPATYDLAVRVARDYTARTQDQLTQCLAFCASAPASRPMSLRLSNLPHPPACRQPSQCGRRESLARSRAPRNVQPRNQSSSPPLAAVHPRLLL
eukprot:7385923-Prymnesium_polylepis.1